MRLDQIVKEAMELLDKIEAPGATYPSVTHRAVELIARLAAQVWELDKRLAVLEADGA